MAIQIPGFSIGFLQANADLTTKQFYCVKPTLDNTFGLCTVAGEPFVGVLQDMPDVGNPGNIMRDGVTKVMIGVGGLTAGQIWMTAADGTAVARASGKVGAGIVLVGGTAGQLASVTIGKQDSGISNQFVDTTNGKTYNIVVENGVVITVEV